MSETLAIGWRPREWEHSEGLNFLRLAEPIDALVAHVTPGLTNATRRARYFAFVPWCVWRYARQGGTGTPREQREVLSALETFFAYASLAEQERAEEARPGIVRSLRAGKRWSSHADPLPLRGRAIGSRPSPLEAAQYGPSLRRLGLVVREGRFFVCPPKGQKLAEILDREVSGLPLYRGLLTAQSVTRSVVGRWSRRLSLGRVSAGERRALRDLLFAEGAYGNEAERPRILSLLAVLNAVSTRKRPSTVRSVELVFATGRWRRSGILPEHALLHETQLTWQGATLLKFLRHSAELAFRGLHDFVDDNPRVFMAAAEAVEALIAKTYQGDACTEVERWLPGSSGERPPWRKWPGFGQAGELWGGDAVLQALRLLEWCHGQLVASEASELLQHRLASVGSGLGSSLGCWHDHLSALVGEPRALVAKWLLIERGIARHRATASRKLAQHDTFRLREDEGGLEAFGTCPVTSIAIRVGAMMSLLCDLGLLRSGGRGYTLTRSGEAFAIRRLERI